jgi:hypothetical protein
MATVRKWVVDLKVYGIKDGVCELKLKPGDALEKIRARKNEFWWVQTFARVERERYYQRKLVCCKESLSQRKDTSGIEFAL